MKVTKENYEAFMIDRIEGALSPADEVELDAFLEQNPKLNAELQLFEMTKLEPDMSITFEGKNSLKKSEGKVIPFMTMSKWMAMAAAIAVVYIGFRFIGNDPQHAEGYQTADFSVEVPVRRASEEQIEAVQEIEAPSTPKTQFANLIEKEDVPPSQETLSPRETEMATMGFAFNENSTLKEPKLMGRIKSADMEASFAYYKGYNYENMMKDVSPLSNEVESIVDRWNDAVATVTDFSSALGLVKSQDNEVKNNDTKTTSIKILGFEYYNHKHTNN